MAIRFATERNRWFTGITTPEGKRVSRYFETKAEALAWEKAALEGIITTRRDDRQVWVRGAANGETLGHLVDICERLDWAGKDPSQWENAVRLAQMLGSGMHPGQLTMRALDDLVMDLRKSGPNGKPLSNTTIRKYINAASVLLKRACRLGWIQAMPLMPEGRTLQLPEPRDLVLREDWFAELLDALERAEHRESLALTLFLRHMGCRVGEALELTWDRVDLRSRRIQFVKTKGNMPRTLPLSDEMVSIVKAMKQRGQQRVFPFSYGTFLSHYSDAKHAACDALQLSKTTRDEWVIHTLRHTCITDLARKGWAAPAIQQWAGHKSLAVTQRYIHAAGINLEALVDC
jgi:site-specific recombinase XerD